MNDTIYRDEAIKKIAEHLGIPAENWKKIAEEWLRDVPSAEKDKKIVLCKDCKHLPECCCEVVAINSTQTSYLYSNISYCSRGE